MAEKAPRKNYLAIAKKKIRHPEEGKRMPRLLVYGRNKKGKTMFGASAPRVLIIDPEHGTDLMLDQQPSVWNIDKWEELDDAYKFLLLDRHDFDWVFLDGLTKMNNMALRFIMKRREERDLNARPGIVDRRDYNKSGELMKEMLAAFHTLPVGVIYSAQERQIGGGDDDTLEEEGGASYVPDLPQGVRGAANGIVDVIGRIYTARVKVKREGKIKEVMQRRLWIAPHPQFDTGYRSDFELPDFVKQPTVQKVVDLIQRGEL